MKRNPKSRFMMRRLLADPITVQRWTNRIIRLQAEGRATEMIEPAPGVKYRQTRNGKLRPIKPKRVSHA